MQHLVISQAFKSDLEGGFELTTIDVMTNRESPCLEGIVAIPPRDDHQVVLLVVTGRIDIESAGHFDIVEI